MAESTEKFDAKSKLIGIKGRGGGNSPYLPVSARVEWFRNSFPDGKIVTEVHLLSDQIAVFVAKVSNGSGGVATGWGSEERKDFNDYVEKAETKAVGRALAHLGYGTESVDDSDLAEYRARPAANQPVQARQAEQQRIPPPDVNGPPTDQQREAIKRIAESKGMGNDQEHLEIEFKLVTAKNWDRMNNGDAAAFIRHLQSLK